jgi:hypothetical protein
VAQLRVTDAAGVCWQPDPATGQWLFWNGSAWAPPAPQPPAYAPPPQAYAPRPQAYAVQPAYAPGHAPVPQSAARPGGLGFGSALISMVPGLAIDFVQRWPFYKANPVAAAQFVAPTIVSSLALAIAPKAGRAVALLLVLGCLGWLAWPLIAGWAGIAGDPGAAVKTNAGRGLVGMSMIYLIPRVWQAGKRA